jgi:hypothetical protein
MSKPKPESSVSEPIVDAFSPKAQYQRFQADSAKALQEVTNSRWLRVSLDAALAQLASKGASSEKLLGARSFIEVLLDLPEKNTKIGQLPKVQLETYDK